jgi:hypothetical protein
MTGPEQPDDLLLALGDLPAQEPDPARSRAVLARATRTIASRRRLAQKRFVVTAAVYGRLLAPLATGGLSAGFIAAAVAQAVVVLQRAHAGIFGP